MFKKFANSLITNAVVQWLPAYSFPDATACGIMLKLQ